MAMLKAFLSRLCGGEATAKILYILAEFLSRLCGGEDIVEFKRDDGNFSKPPMWR